MSGGAIDALARCENAAESSAGLSADFARLYQQHKDAVYRLALRYGSGRQAWAEDMVQDVFLTALEDSNFGSGRWDPGAWLYRVTVNRCLTRLKRERVFRILSGVLGRAVAAEHRTPERSYRGSEALSVIDRWFDGLPATEKVVFAMHVHDAKSQTEIAEILGFSKGYVSKLLARATSKLQALQGVGTDG